MVIKVRPNLRRKPKDKKKKVTLTTPGARKKKKNKLSDAQLRTVGRGSVLTTPGARKKAQERATFNRIFKFDPDLGGYTFRKKISPAERERILKDFKMQEFPKGFPEKDKSSRPKKKREPSLGHDFPMYLDKPSRPKRKKKKGVSI